MVTNPTTGSNCTPRVDHYENPYYLHNNDHAGLVLVSDKLTTGAEFHSWRRSIRMALNVRNKLGFIDGTMPKPAENHRDFGSWSRCNDMVTTWLINSVCKKIGQSLLFIPTAEGIWKNLMSRFKQDDAPRIFEIEQRLSQIQQGATDVSTYYTELITLWEEYKNYVELPVCTCGKCECSAAALWEKLMERSRVTKFLMGLNESYESSRRHILMLKPIPSIEEVFNMITSDERQKTIKPASNGSNVVFQTSDNCSNQAILPNLSQSPVQNMESFTGPYDNNVYAAVHNQYRPRFSRPICTHCGQTGHVIQKCFKLHGYPPGYVPGYKNNNSGFPSSQRPPAQQFQARGSAYNAPRNQNHPVANVMTDVTVNAESSHPYVPPPAMNTVNLDVSQMTSEQAQSLIHQLSAHVKVSETQAPSPFIASITDHGFMADQSSSGVYSGLDDW